MLKAKGSPKFMPSYDEKLINDIKGDVDLENLVLSFRIFFVESKDFDLIGSAFSLEIRPVCELRIPSLHIRPTPVCSGGSKIFI